MAYSSGLSANGISTFTSSLYAGGVCLDLLCERTGHGVELGCSGLSTEPLAESNRKKPLIVMESSPSIPPFTQSGQATWPWTERRWPRVYMGKTKRARDRGPEQEESVGEGGVERESKNELVESPPPAKKAKKSEKYTLGDVVSLLTERNSLVAGNFIYSIGVCDV